MTTFIFNGKDLKYKCVKAYCKVILDDAKKQNGEICNNNSDFVMSQLKEIEKIIINTKSTYEDLEDIIKNSMHKMPYVSKVTMRYYNEITKQVEKKFESGKYWIPSFLVSSLLNEYKVDGYKDFKEFDLLALMETYEKFEDKKSLKSHFECTALIKNRLDKIKGLK